MATLAPLFFIGSSSFFSGNKDNHKISTKLEFRPDLTTDWGISCPWAFGKIPIDLQWWICCGHSSAFYFDSIFFIFAGNEDMHTCWYEFNFLPDCIIDYGVICPWTSNKLTYNLVATLALSFLIGTSSLLKVMRICMKAWMSLNFGKIPQQITE